jgi:hypothetical protein
MMVLPKSLAGECSASVRLSNLVLPVLLLMSLSTKEIPVNAHFLSRRKSGEA